MKKKYFVPELFRLTGYICTIWFEMKYRFSINFYFQTNLFLRQILAQMRRIYRR